MRLPILGSLALLVSWLTKTDAVAKTSNCPGGLALPNLLNLTCHQVGDQCHSPSNCCSNSCVKKATELACKCGKSGEGGKCSARNDCKKCRRKGKLCRTSCKQAVCVCKCRDKPVQGGGGSGTGDGGSGTGSGGSEDDTGCAGVTTVAGDENCTYPTQVLAQYVQCSTSSTCENCSDTTCSGNCWDQACILENAGREGGRGKCADNARKANFTCQCFCPAKVGQFCETYADCKVCESNSECSRECVDTACTAKCNGRGDVDCYKKCNDSPTKGRQVCSCQCPTEPPGATCASYKDCAPCPTSCSRECDDNECYAKCVGTNQGDCISQCVKNSTRLKNCRCQCPYKLGAKCNVYQNCEPCANSKNRKCLPLTSDQSGTNVCQCV